MEEDFLGNALYTLYGDSSIEADELGNLFVNFLDTSYYTTAAGTKGDWLLRQYGESIIVRDDNGIAYARAEDGDWYISSLSRVNADTNPVVETNRLTGQEQAGVEADPLNQELNYSLADAKPASGNAELAKDFYERWQYNYEIRVGPANPATVRDWDYFDIGSATPEEVDQYYELQDAKENSLVDTIREMWPVEGVSNSDYSMLYQENGLSPQSGSKELSTPDNSRFVNTDTSMVVNKNTLLYQNGILSGQAKVVNLSSDNSAYWQKAPEYTSVSYNGRTYNIYVPWSGSDMNSGGWQTVEVLDTTLWDFNISRFASGFAVPRVDVKPIVETGETFVYSHQPDRQGVAALSGISLYIGTGESILKSLDKTPIQVVRQENNGDTRIVMQVGLNSGFFQQNAGKTVTGSEDMLTNRAFRLTLDARHAQDPFTAFMSINENGQFVLTPKVYSGDKFEVGRSGFWGASDFREITMSPTIISKDGQYKSLADKLEEILSRW